MPLNPRIQVSPTPNPDILRLLVPCPECKKKKGFDILSSQWNDGMATLRQGHTMQTAFPDLSPDDRELLISGVCSSCWTRLFRD